MSLKDLSENQIKILALKELGCSFTEISEELGISEKIANVNYCYALQKYKDAIPNKDSVLTEKQKEDIKEALEAIKSHLRELKKLDDQALQDIVYNPQDLISISKEMADKIGVEFDENEFI